MNDKKYSLLKVKNLKKFFPVYGGTLFGKVTSWVKAVNDVSFEIKNMSTMALVGESGCGKSTIANCIVLLLQPDSGEILVDGADILNLNSKDLRGKRKEIQLIFQDPYSSLNTRWNIKQIVEEPLIINKRGSSLERSKKIIKLLEMVGISSKWLNKYPHELSGGQRQRVSIARALTLEPKLLICDEPVSALDVSIQAQILNLLLDLKNSFGISYLFISHDLGVVKYLSDFIAVMYLGKIVETTKTNELFNNPLHPYAQALLSAAKPPDVIIGNEKKEILLKGDVPDPSNPPNGCFFNTRCMFKKDICSNIYPPMKEIKKGHFVACFRAKDFIKDI